MTLPQGSGIPPVYLQRYCLSRRPFPATPDAACYYPATPHEAALAPLVRALEDNEGLALLTGEPGTGKTLLGQVLLERLHRAVATAFLTNSHFPDRSSLLQAILFDLGLPYADGSEQVLRLRLTDQILNNCRDGKRTIVLIDEAQHLSPDLLEELRLLGNLEAGSEKAFQAICLAQTSMVATLKRPELSAWKQRLAVHVHLGALSAEESFDYLRHHLRLAGGNPDKIIDDAGLEALAHGARGIPRLLNQAAHHALVLADAAELETIDAEAALEALTVIGLQPADSEGSGLEESSTEALGDEAFDADLDAKLALRKSA